MVGVGRTVEISTIQLADINGDGHDELLARNDQGLEVYWFDTTLGQWRPQVDANGVQQVLRDFRSPLPSDAGAPGLTSQGTTNWKQPEYYSTIQAANIDGQPGKEILARFADGMHVYKYFPPAGTNNIDGGTWKLIGTGGPFSDAAGYNDPSLYTTIGVGQFSNDQSSGAPWNPTAPMLFARQHGEQTQPTVASTPLTRTAPGVQCRRATRWWGRLTVSATLTADSRRVT